MQGKWSNAENFASQEYEQKQKSVSHHSKYKAKNKLKK